MAESKFLFKTKEQFLNLTSKEYDQIVYNIKMKATEQLVNQVPQITKEAVDQMLPDDLSYPLFSETLNLRVSSELILKLNEQILFNLKQSSNPPVKAFISRQGISITCKDIIKLPPLLIDNKYYSEKAGIAIILKLASVAFATILGFIICPDENTPTTDIELVTVPFETDEL